MTTTLEKLERLDEPILIDELSWREFKAVEQLLSRPGGEAVVFRWGIGD